MLHRFKNFLFFLCITLSSVFLANWSINNIFVQKFARSFLNEKITSFTNLTLDFTDMQLSIFPLRMTLVNLLLDYPQPASPQPSHPLLLTSSEFTVQISFWSILLGEPKIKLIEAQGLSAHLPYEWEFAKIFKEDSPKSQEGTSLLDNWPPDFKLPINELKLIDSNIYFEFPSRVEIPLTLNWMIGSLEDLNISLKFNNWRDFRGQLRCGRTSLAWDESSIIENTSVQTSLVFDGQVLKGESLLINGERLQGKGGLRVELDTKGRTIEGVRLVANVDAKADFSFLGSILDAPDTYGKAQAALTFTSYLPVASTQPPFFTLEGKGQLENAYLSNIRLFDSEVSFSMDSEHIFFDEVIVKKEGSVLGTAQGKIELNPDLDFFFHIKPESLPLSHILNAFENNFNLFDFDLISDDAILSGTGQPLHINIVGTAELANVTLPATPYDHSVFPTAPMCRMNIDIGIDEEKFTFHNNKGNCFLPAVDYVSQAPSPLAVRAPKDATMESDLSIDGNIFFEKGTDITFVSEKLNLPLAQYFSQTTLTGLGKIKGNITEQTLAEGKHKTVVQTDFSIKEASIMSVPLGKFEGTVFTEKDLVSWEDVRATFANGGNAQFKKGSFVIPTFYFESYLEGKEIPNDFVHNGMIALFSEADYSFQIGAVKGQLKGPLRFPAAYAGELEGTLTNVVDRGHMLAESIAFKTNNSPTEWNVPYIKAMHSGFALLGNGKITKHQKFSEDKVDQSGFWTKIGFSKGDGVNFKFLGKNQGNSRKEEPPNHLNNFPYFESEFKNAKIMGTLEAHINLEGVLGRIEGVYDGVLDHFQVLGAHLPPLKVKGFIHNSTIETMFDHSGNIFQGRLDFDFLQKDWPFEWYFNFTRFDIRAFGSSIFYSDPRNYAYLTANWHLKGYLRDWWRAQGTLEVKDLKIKFNRDQGNRVKAFTLSSDNPATILFTKDGWSYEKNIPLKFSSRYAQATLNILESRPPMRLRIGLDSQIDLAVLPELTKQIESASGMVQCNSLVFGEVSNLKFATKVASLEGKDENDKSKTLNILAPDFSPEFKNVSVDAVIEDGFLNVHKFYAQKGNGFVKGFGKLHLWGETGEASNLNISFDQFRLVYNLPFLKSFDSILSGDLGVTGQRGSYLLRGDVKVLKSRSTRNFDIAEEVVGSVRRETLNTNVNATPEESFAKFDINLKADKSITINTKNLQLLASADLRVTGDNSKPVLLGNVHFIRGKFIYKKDFKITRGEITFDDPVKTDPKLDILATADINPYHLSFAVSGKTSQPVIEILIDPPTRDDGTIITRLDALLLLTRGSLPLADEKNAEAQIGLTEALNIYTSQLPFEKLSEISGQNIVQPYLNTTTDETGAIVPQINFPISFSDYFEAVIQKTPSKTSASIQMPLHENISVSGNYSNQKIDEVNQGVNQNQRSVDLKFRFFFK